MTANLPDPDGRTCNAASKSYTPEGEAGTPATPAHGRPDLSGGSVQRMSAQPAPDRTATEAVGMPAASVPNSSAASGRIAGWSPEVHDAELNATDVRDFETEHAHNLHLLGLIRDDRGWALSRVLLAERLERAVRHVVSDSPGTPHSVKKYLLRELEGYWGEPYEEAMLRADDA